MQDQEGRTALHYACDAEEKVRIVSALVEAGGDPNMSDFSGRTPIDDAREGSRGGLLSILERGPRRVSECGVGEGGVGRFSCEEDTITLRGEVWVARRLMPVPETLPDTHSDQGGQGAPVWGLQTVVLPPAPAGARPGKGSQDGAFATWGATHLGGRQVRAGVPQNLLASVDLTRSVVDDWIVVDEDDDLFRRDAAARSSQRELPLGVGASAVEVMSGAVSEVRKNIRWALDSSLSKATMMWPFTGSSREGADGVRK